MGGRWACRLGGRWVEGIRLAGYREVDWWGGRDVGGREMRSGRQVHGRAVSVRFARAVGLSGPTLPVSESSPVIATSDLGGLPVAMERREEAIAIPADGPSFGVAPSGTCMCRLASSRYRFAGWREVRYERA